MSGKFVRRSFSEININDPFFDSLKQDYPGTSASTGFNEWFEKKARCGAYALVFEDEQGIAAFISLKKEDSEAIYLQGGMIRPESRLKISTIKIDQRYRHQRIGEGALGLILWAWRDSSLNQIYVTVFDYHKDLIGLLEEFGFKCVGYSQNGERVYIKDRRNLDFSDPCKSFPFINGNMIYQAGLLVINMEYHDTMFAYSELANAVQERVDASVGNGLKKVYIGNPASLAIQEGQPVLIYRKYTGASGTPGFKSVITSYCIATKVERFKQYGQFPTQEQFRAMVGNKSVFTDPELKERYNASPNLTLIELLYMGYFGAGNNVNWYWLHEHGLWPNTYPTNFQYTKEQFETILCAGNVDVSNVIVH